MSADRALLRLYPHFAREHDWPPEVVRRLTPREADALMSSWATRGSGGAAR